jgi:diaminopimelate epimerase
MISDMKIKFTKMQALGNDYLYVDCFKQPLAGFDRSDLAKRICDRHFGVGADGLILVSPGRTHRFRMIFYNPDGTEAEMCGNGIRCFARFLHDSRLSRSKMQDIETKAGVIKTEIVEATDDDFLIRADIGKPILDRSKIPVKGKGRFCIGERLKLKRGSVKITSISLGNPHTVILVKEFSPRWREIGRMVEDHPAFPRRTNVEFARILGRSRIRLKIWERGVGETLASGTGASAATVAGVLAGKLNRRVRVSFDNRGELLIEWNEANDRLYMTGPATSVFSGVYAYYRR